ncbi:MAG: hypothetical protein ABSE55_05190 [Terracidiphilus sp.]
MIVNSRDHTASTGLLALVIAPLAHLRALDIAVIAIYFGMVIWIGLDFNGRSKAQALRENDVYCSHLRLNNNDLQVLPSVHW